MFFIGEGGLLTRAVDFVISLGLPIDGIVTQKPLPKRYREKYNIDILETIEINEISNWLLSKNSDGLVWSINNKCLIKPNLLNLPGFTFLNIHNGLVPNYRGRAEICVFFSILNSEQYYGATLHEIDEGIDTGPVLATKKFAINAEDTFATVMSKSILQCHDLFKLECYRLYNLKIINQTTAQKKVTKEIGETYSYKSLVLALPFKKSPSWRKAIELGPYSSVFPKLSKWINSISE